MQRLVRAGVLLVAQPVIERAGGEEGRGSATHWQRHTVDHRGTRPGEEIQMRPPLPSLLSKLAYDLYIKTNILPRQARDKHGENSKKGRLSDPFHECINSRWFTKTGSGHA
jgi:hypothetical protein